MYLITTKLLENQKDKEAFFAQYWGQKVGIIGRGKEYKSNAWINESYFNSVNSLLLKSLENISDEDAKYIAKIYGWPDNHENYDEKVYQFKIDLQKMYSNRHSIQVFDYLRLRGYLLPFRNYSIEEILNMGWVVYE